MQLSFVSSTKRLRHAHLRSKFHSGVCDLVRKSAKSSIFSCICMFASMCGEYFCKGTISSIRICCLETFGSDFKHVKTELERHSEKNLTARLMFVFMLHGIKSHVRPHYLTATLILHPGLLLRVKYRF